MKETFFGIYQKQKQIESSGWILQETILKKLAN